MVRKMKQGAVIVDISVDQGACVETMHPTSYSTPTFVVSGVVHYGVPNIPAAVPRTSTLALTNATLPWALEIADVRPALLVDEASKRRALDLLRFRHRFRNLYGEDLDPKKTAEVQKIAFDFIKDFSKMHADFREKLRAIAGELG
jgi:hypothetical protein